MKYKFTCHHCGKGVGVNNYAYMESVDEKGKGYDRNTYHRKCFAKVYGFETVKEFSNWMEERGN